MHSKRRQILQAALAGAALPLGAMASLQPANASATLDPQARQMVDALMREHGIAGLAIATTQRGKQAFHNFGVASKATGQAVSSQTLFEIGSISKTFTALLASHAAVAGRLKLGDSPAKFLPELDGSEIAKADLLGLATHTTGGFPLQFPDGIGTREQLMAYYRAWQPSYAAGSARTYANPSIGLLGMVAAKAWGMPFDAAMEKMLFPALGLHDTFLTMPEAAMPRYAQGYDKADAPVRVNPGMLAHEAYGVKTSAQDLLRWVELNLDPSKAPAELAQAISATHTGYFKLGAMTQALVWELYAEQAALADLLEGNSSKMALQTHRVQRLAPPQAPQQAGLINKTGATGGFGAYVAFMPRQQAGVVLLANRNYPNAARVRLAHRILHALEG